MALTVVAAYDVRDDGRRAKLAAVLQSYGERVQFSVFVLSLPESELDELRERADQILDLERDSLVIFRQCCTCWEQMAEVGQAVVQEEPLAWVVV